MNRILVYDGSDEKSMLIGEVFGENLYYFPHHHNVAKSFSSLGKSIYIDFKKEYNYETLKFAASIKYNNINSDCQSWLDKEILLSPKDPNINCSWIITRQFGSYITLDFFFIEVKQMNYDSKDAII